MNKRQFLQVLPLASLTTTAIRIDSVEARVHELQPEKKYLIVIPAEITEEQAARFSNLLRERLGPNAIAVTGEAAVSLKVYDLNENGQNAVLDIISKNSEQVKRILRSR